MTSTQADAGVSLSATEDPEKTAYTPFAGTINPNETAPLASTGHHEKNTYTPSPAGTIDPNEASKELSLSLIHI